MAPGTKPAESPDPPTKPGQTGACDDPEDFLRQLEILDDGDFNTLEELQLSTPYSDTKAWIRMLRSEVITRGNRLNGPPGLRGRIERKYGEMSILEYMSKSRM